MSPHRDGWSPRWVILNTLFTGLGAVAGSAALILYIAEKFK
jgi:hypothetical protein